jgi:diguanylate cyclase (GGDEF)-like protein/PAS domain S-box-containing protein
MHADTARIRVLVVEDEAIVARDIEQQLLELGYQVVAICATGEQALELAGQLRPALVLMDIQLAGEMDGIAAAQLIREQFALPVVFITAYSADEVLESAKLSEPYGYILKPFSERELRTVIEMALYKYAAEVKQRGLTEHLAAIVENMLDGLITIDQRGRVESFNKAAATIFGYSAAEVIGQNVSMLMPESQRSEHDGYLQAFQHKGDGSLIKASREVEGRRRDGSQFPMSLLVSQTSRQGQVIYIGLVRDISQQRRDIEAIHHLAFYDPLTQLPNRRLLLDRLQQAMHASERSGLHGALMFLDLDNFKQLNDSQGHVVGDELLQQVALRLQTCVRAGDSVARLGGDEFVVLLEALSHDEHDSAAQAELLANKILRALGQPYELREAWHNSTPSIGVVVFMQGHESLEELLKTADLAMYQAKAAGRNTVRFYDPVMQAAAAERIELAQAMRLGLQLNEFILHYQIQVDGAGVGVGVEALVRWRNPQRGMVSPADFIPLAEESGVILPLGQWVLETACRQLQQWAEDPLTARWSMAVNVSASQFAQTDFVACVAAALGKTGADPGLLKLELTESMLVSDVEDIILKMQQIKALGLSFSLDDFGTGYSSLSFLKLLPLDQLKIDQSFVRNLLTDPDDAVIATTIIALGRNLGLKVIAEGVETAEQRDFLISVGCDAFQGYYFGRPMQANEVLAQLLKKIR